MAENPYPEYKVVNDFLADIFGVLDISVEVEYEGTNIAYVYIEFASQQDCRTFYDEVCRNGKSELRYKRMAPERGAFVGKFHLTLEGVKALYDVTSRECQSLPHPFRLGPVDPALIDKYGGSRRMEEYLEGILEEAIIDI